MPNSLRVKSFSCNKNCRKGCQLIRHCYFSSTNHLQKSDVPCFSPGGQYSSLQAIWRKASNRSPRLNKSGRPQRNDRDNFVKHFHLLQPPSLSVESGSEQATAFRGQFPAFAAPHVRHEGSKGWKSRRINLVVFVSNASLEKSDKAILDCNDIDAKDKIIYHCPNPQNKYVEMSSIVCHKETRMFDFWLLPWHLSTLKSFPWLVKLKQEEKGVAGQRWGPCLLVTRRV